MKAIVKIVAVLSLLQCFATQNAFSESPAQEVTIGTSRITLRPPYGFTECSGLNQHLTRLFAVLAQPGQTPLTGYLTDGEYQKMKEGVSPDLVHIASSFTLASFSNKMVSEAEFAEARNVYRTGAKQAVEAGSARVRAFAAKTTGYDVPDAKLVGVFLDDPTAIAYLSRSPASAGERPRVQAIAMLLIKGKMIGLDLNKVCSGETDLEWVKKAMLYWISRIRSDNP